MAAAGGPDIESGLDTTQLLKGVLDMAVLAVLEEEDGYGYDIVRRLREAGIHEVGDASVYGTLRRLFRSGALSSYVVPSDEGPHRKYYGLTPLGVDQFRLAVKGWREFTSTLDRLVSERSDRRPGSIVDRSAS